VVNSLEDIAEKAVGYALTIGCQYCDVRAENITKQGFLKKIVKLSTLLQKMNKV